MALADAMPLIGERLAAGGRVRLSPKGTSMLPMLRQGVDSVELKAAPDRLARYDLPLYRRASGAYVLHRVVAQGADGSYTCCGDNQADPEPGVRHDQVVAVVSAFWRGGRRVEASDPLYLAYARVRVASLPLRRALVRARRLAGRLLRGLGPRR